MTANARINTFHNDNILVDDGGLYVSGAQIEQNKEDIADIRHIIEGTSGIVDELHELETTVDGINTSLNAEILRSTEKDRELEHADERIIESVSNLSNTVNTQGERIETIRDGMSELRLEVTQNKLIAQAAVDAEQQRAMNAETLLNDKIEQIQVEVEPITVDDTSTVDLNLDGNKVLTAKVLVANSNDNIVKAASDTSLGSGIYASVDLDYNAAENKLTLRTSNGRDKEIQLSMGSIIKSITYDSVGKNLIITYDVNTAGVIHEEQVFVPVEDLFNDWVVQQGEHLGAIILHKDQGAPGDPDVLSAEVVLSTLEDNMLINDMGALYVSGGKINEISAATVDNRELINTVIQGAGLASDGKFDFSAMSGHRHIADAQNITDATIKLNDALDDVVEQFEEMKNGANSLSTKVYKNAEDKLAVDVKVFNTPNRTDTTVTYTDAQYAALTMRNLLKIANLVDSDLSTDKSGIFFDGSIDYGEYDDSGRITYSN